MGRACSTEQNYVTSLIKPELLTRFVRTRARDSTRLDFQLTPFDFLVTALELGDCWHLGW